MDSTQDVDSAPDQSQPATDPLAIEQPGQTEPNSGTADTEPTKQPPTSALEEDVAPSQSQPQQQDASISVVQHQPTEPAPTSSVPSLETASVKPSSSEAAATTPIVENVIKSPAPESMTDPLAPSEFKPQEECESTEPDADPKPPPPMEDNGGSSVPAPPENGVSVSSSEPTVDYGQSSKVEATATSTEINPSATASNAVESAIDAPTSSSNGMSNSSSNTFIGSSSNNNTNNSIGVKSSVTSDNNLQINGISDLSILDVTEGTDNEIEVKVEGGSLMHKVIKFSLLNGMQDSSKRLENSRLIMSGVSSARGEATLATTSSLTRNALGGGPLRQDDKAKEEGFKGGTQDSKTTPPACSSVRPGSVEPSSSFSNSSNSSDSSQVNNSENVEPNPNRTEEPTNRLRHSVDSNVSASSSESVREESVSDTYCRSASLDFREWPKASTTSPTAPASTTTATTIVAAASTAASLDLSNTNQETDQPTSAANSSAKRPMAMYYTELPDFSKPVFTAPSSSVTTPTSTTSGGQEHGFPSAKSLSQLQMKTPDFSRAVPTTVAAQPSSSSIPSTPVSSTPVTTSTPRSHELQIANPDFSKSFAAKLQQTPPASRADERSAYLNPAAFAEISKQRNYISDLQLKNPPNHPETTSQPHSSVVKLPTSTAGPSLSNYRIEKPLATPKPYPPSLYRQEPTTQVTLEEPKAHVIHKTPTSTLPETAKTWNPAVEYGSQPYSQAPNERDRYNHQYSTTNPKGPPPLTSEAQSHAYPGYLPYPTSKSKDSAPVPQQVPASHPGGIIVNNTKSYHPEQQQALSKSREAEFRLEQKEKQLRQEGTIITLKSTDTRPPPNPTSAQSSHYPPQSYHAPRPRSPSAERREAQMMASSQEILYRDFKLKQSYEMPPQSSTRVSSGSRPPEDPRARAAEQIPRDRSPYDAYFRGAYSSASATGGPPPSKYYAQQEHHKQPNSPASSATPSPTPLHAQNRSPVPVPTKSLHPGGPGGPAGPGGPGVLGGPVGPGGSGMMHPPSNWPSQSRVVPSPHGGSAASSPSAAPPSVSPNHFTLQKNSPSPVHSYGPQPTSQPGPSHQYKSPSPSACSTSPYGGVGVPPNAITKYTQYYPGANGERVVSIEVDKETYKSGYKGLDYNMEQKFAEVYQAHQMKAKEPLPGKPVDPYKGQPYPNTGSEYARHGMQHPHPSSHQSVYKPTDHKAQETYRDEYGRSRAVSTSANLGNPQSAVPMTNTRYATPQEHLNHYNQYYQQRMSAEAEMRKPDSQMYKPSSRDPSPSQRYATSESLYHPPKQQPYPAAQSSASKAIHHPAYPNTGSEPSGPLSQYGLPGKSSYPSSSYERAPEKQPSVISNAYSQERAGPRTAYPEARQHPQVDHYPSGHQYQPAQSQMKATSTQPYPQHPNHPGYPAAPSSNRDKPWHYQQQPQHQQHQQQPHHQQHQQHQQQQQQQQQQQHQQQQHQQQQQQQQQHQQQQQQQQHQQQQLQQQHLHQQQHQPPPQQPGPSGYNTERFPVVRDERQNPVIQPPISKNIPVKVIATAKATPAAPTSTTVAPATSTTKRESPLDLSVKTVKTKADSTACDDYAQSSRNREVPKVNFNPNFKKHIPVLPERTTMDQRPVQPSQPQSHHSQMPREPQPIPPNQQHLQQPATSSKSSPGVGGPQEQRQIPVVSPAIPPGYDRKTDAYMSANYRAVGGQHDMRDARLQQDNRYPPLPSRLGPGDQQRELPVAYGAPPGSYPNRLPPGVVIPQHPYQQPPVGAPPKTDPYYPSNARPIPSATSRSVYYPPHESARGSKHPGVSHKPTMDDPRIEDRKFVESMLKKQASPSAEVIADLQAGKFSTRLPTALAPAKKRPAETIPKTSPTKVPRVEESNPNLHRPYDTNYRHAPYPGPAAPKDYYPVPIKHEPASPQPAGVYYATDKRSEAPSITRGVLTSAPTHPLPTITSNSVLQPNIQQNARAVDQHPSVITSYQPNRPEILHRPREEQSQQKDYRQPYSQPEEHPFYPKPEPFRDNLGDPKYYGPPIEKQSRPPTDRPDPNNHSQHPPTIVMHSHIQYSGHQPMQSLQYKRPEVVQKSPRPDYFNSSNHIARPPSIVENNHRRSYENIPRLTNDPPKPSLEQRVAPQHLNSSQESISQPSSTPSSQHRGADQSVISKLRTSLEQKERINQLRKQTSSEMSEEDTKPLDMNSFPPSHFRSKGAMKAYTPIPAFDTPSSTPQQQQQQQPPQPVEPPRPPSPVKMEPVEIPKDPIAPPVDIEGTSALDLLDWGSACNEFVEQLQTGKKRGRRKRGIGAKRDPEASPHDTFRSDLPGTANSTLSEVPQEVLKSAAQEIGDFATSSDEDKPLLLLKQQQHSSTGELKEEQLRAIKNFTMEKPSEKIARNMREKQRLELEQKHEAKLGRSSSSESESDTRRVAQRSKMRARKLRNRSSVPLKSDVNTDGEDEEEEEDQARDLRKRKKIDQTSSDSETGTNVKKLNRCQSQIKQENGTDVSSDEEDPKCRSSSKKHKASELKLDCVRRGAKQSDSDTNYVKTKDSVNDKTNREAEAQSSGSESEKSEKDTKKGTKKSVKSRTTSRSKIVDESSESEESVEEETMTRSKSKLELEKRRSNSKVLRNDKIVENYVKDRKKQDSITPQKGRKGVVNVKLEASKKRILDSDSDSKSIGVKKRSRKASKLQTTSASDSSEESDIEPIRLRSRKPKASETSAPSSTSKRGNSRDGRTPSKGSASEKKNNRADPPKKRGRQPKKTSKDCATENTSENFYPGWEKEFYEFKRSLKVPLQLITVGGRKYVHRISTSLPDLDSHHSDESETFSEIVKKINQKDVSVSKKVKTKAAAKQGLKTSNLTKEQQEEEKKIDGNKKFTSIIEILHERMLRHVKMAKGKKSKKNNDKETEPKPEFELLPTPGAESEALFNRKKKSLFDTAILKSRTRTEQKVMQSKEIIREVFGGDDERPQSAPPLGCDKELKNVTYDEMYNDMLTKSNNVATFLAQKKAQEEKAIASCSGRSAKVKIEDLDDETQDSVLKDSGRVTEEGDTPSVVSERDLATPVSFKGIGKKKTHKSRRKGSSGFDYIRKKKKPTVNNGENSTPVVPKKKITSVFENLESKDETHISKEIRSWVLNKGVGESVMHKAARLGYTDVIVYCLERLDMDPDMKDNAGYTPLHEACAKGHLDICNYLLQYGASHSETALSGIRPLHEAVENSFTEVVRLLLAFGADPMLATYAGQTPIQLAENNEMELFLENHLYDIQSMTPTKIGWKSDGPWKTHDPEESGCDIFADIPGFLDEDNQHNSSTTTERSSLSNSIQSDVLDSKPVCLPPPPPPLPPPPSLLPPVPSMTPKKCDSNSNIMNFEVKQEAESIYERKYKDCAVVLNDIHELNAGRTTTAPPAYINGQLRPMDVKRELPEDCPTLNGNSTRYEESDDDDDEEFVFEYEEAERPLPPLYLLRDEAIGEKWVLMTDLCNFLKLKSKEAVMKQICSSATSINAANATTTPAQAPPPPPPPPPPTATTNGNRELIRELKIEDFLTRASCLQLLCAGEKLNINSNKVILVKYNESVRNLLQVQTLVTKI